MLHLRDYNTAPNSIGNLIVHVQPTPWDRVELGQAWVGLALVVREINSFAFAMIAYEFD